MIKIVFCKMKKSMDKKIWDNFILQITTISYKIYLFQKIQQQLLNLFVVQENYEID